jgi:4-hydroxybenzoate polyprenyltransferase
LGNWKAWGQIVRVPNTLTSCADVLAGMCIAGGVSHSFLTHPWPALLGALASVSMYWGGMALNDVLDVEEDTQSGRPGPLVTGAIRLSVARRVSFGLLGIGVVLAIAAAACMQEEATWRPMAWLPAFAVAVALVLSIVAYDGPLKRTPLAPWVMGLCRALNMGLGMVLVAGGLGISLGPHAWMVLLGHGLYVSGFTIAARRESDLLQSRTRLLAGWSVSLVGALFLAFSSAYFPTRSLHLEPYAVFPGLVMLLLLPLMRRALHSIISLQPPKLGMAIKQAIVSILFLDAVLALQYAGNWAGFIVCALVVPTLWLGRAFRST